MARHRLILDTVRTDNTFMPMQKQGETVWSGKCIHCNSRLVVTQRGDTEATIEHIVPQALGGTDALTNVGLACRRCNNLKGKRMDARPAKDPGLQALIAKLLAKRQARWREPSGTD